MSNLFVNAPSSSSKVLGPALRCQEAFTFAQGADPKCGEALENHAGRLIERMGGHPRETRCSFEVELEGEIAAMVALAQGAERSKAARHGAAVPDAFRRSVKVVAGAGFEPATFRL